MLGIFCHFRGFQGVSGFSNPCWSFSVISGHLGFPDPCWAFSVISYPFRRMFTPCGVSVISYPLQRLLPLAADSRPLAAFLVPLGALLSQGVIPFGAGYAARCSLWAIFPPWGGKSVLKGDYPPWWVITPCGDVSPVVFWGAPVVFLVPPV